MKICSDLTDCGVNAYCNLATNLCESCHVICNSRIGTIVECRKFCPDMYRRKGKKVKGAQKSLLTKTSQPQPVGHFSTDVPQHLGQSAAIPGFNTAFQAPLLVILICTSLLIILVITSTCFLVLKSWSTGGKRTDNTTVSSTASQSSGKNALEHLIPEAAHHQNDPELADKENENETDSLLVLSGIDNKNSESELAESPRQCRGRCAISSSLNSPGSTETTEHTVIKSPNTSETAVAEESRSKEEEICMGNQGQNSDSAENCNQAKISPNRLLQQSESPPQRTKAQAPPCTDTEEVHPFRTPIPRPKSRQPDRTNVPAEEVRLEIEEFYYSYHKSGGRNSPPPSKTTKFEEVSLLEAQKDDQINPDEVRLMNNVLYKNQRVEEKKEEALSVVNMRIYSEEEEDSDSGHGSDETLLKDQNPGKNLHPQSSLSQSLQKHTEQNPHPNLRLYAILNKIGWVQSIYSEGASICVYVDFNDISPDVALKELTSKTGCESNKFHIKHREWVLSYPQVLA